MKNVAFCCRLCQRSNKQSKKLAYNDTFWGAYRGFSSWGINIFEKQMEKVVGLFEIYVREEKKKLCLFAEDIHIVFSKIIPKKIELAKKIVSVCPRSSYP